MDLPVCPQCETLNKPDCIRCRRCGTRLRESARADSMAEPVVLERVMSGEIFSAVFGGSRATSVENVDSADATDTPPSAEAHAGEAQVGDALEEVFREKMEKLEAIRRMLLDHEARLERREKEVEAMARRVQASTVPLTSHVGAPSPAGGWGGNADTSRPAAGSAEGPEDLEVHVKRLREWEAALAAREKRLRLVLFKLFPKEMANISAQQAGAGTNPSLPAMDDGPWTSEKVGSLDSLLENALEGRVEVPEEATWEPKDVVADALELRGTAPEVIEDQPPRIKTHVQGLDSSLEEGSPRGTSF